MKKLKVIIITVQLLAGIIGLVAQENNASIGKFSITINGKQFHSTDTIQKADLSNIPQAALEINNTETGKKIKTTAYQFVISVKDSNTIWKFVPAVNNFDKMKSIIWKAKTNDIVWIDDMKFNGEATGFPKEFVFHIK